MRKCLQVGDNWVRFGPKTKKKPKTKKRVSLQTYWSALKKCLRCLGQIVRTKQLAFTNLFKLDSFWRFFSLKFDFERHFHAFPIELRSPFFFVLVDNSAAVIFNWKFFSSSSNGSNSMAQKPMTYITMGNLVVSSEGLKYIYEHKGCSSTCMKLLFHIFHDPATVIAWHFDTVIVWKEQ